ncbi:hypothetical protein G5I_02318 [Acromyrmex echinatior]|uniref:Uncharacterized protein n=1 Tax=Acromyrmex echinatior TaxID=103372 RepID=F4WA05_ACREC|nr:hypothetical protein G5I_02318 [Acromyrmex echinatior]
MREKEENKHLGDEKDTKREGRKKTATLYLRLPSGEGGFTFRAAVSPVSEPLLKMYASPTKELLKHNLEVVFMFKLEVVFMFKLLRQNTKNRLTTRGPTGFARICVSPVGPWCDCSIEIKIGIFDEITENDSNKKKESIEQDKTNFTEQEEEEVESTLRRLWGRVTHPDHDDRYDPIRSPSLCCELPLTELKRFSGYEIVVTRDNLDDAVQRWRSDHCLGLLADRKRPPTTGRLTDGDEKVKFLILQPVIRVLRLCRSALVLNIDIRRIDRACPLLWREDQFEVQITASPEYIVTPLQLTTMPL